MTWMKHTGLMGGLMLVRLTEGRPARNETPAPVGLRHLATVPAWQPRPQAERLERLS
ncbi:MAG: hypothetical protein MI755_06620 [Sphingomonadales bacterium]|nr:hypothetical protein [Sphingomonadales bacterium]